MTIAYPAVLLLLVIPVALIWRDWRGRGQRVVFPFDHSVRRGGRFLTFGVRFAHTLPPLVLAVVIVILAGPRQLTEPQSKRVLTNIQFCLDVSGSMTSEFGGQGTRYDAAMQAINDFIMHRKGDAYGLTVFGSSVLQWVPLTSDPSAFRCATPFLDPQRLPNWFGGGTMIGMGLNECLKVLSQREEGDRMIILLSDGYSFDLGNGNDETIARKLRQHGVTVYTVHIAEGGPPEQLYTIADITGGHVFAAGDMAALQEVFKRIDQMKLTRIEKTLPETRDWFFPFCVAGLGVLGAAALCLFGLRITPW